MDGVEADDLDIWARWLLEVRHGGEADCLQRTLDELAPVRDRVLNKASLGESDVVLDVGAGDGLIAFGALARVGPNGRVIFSDVSRDLLEHCAKLAEEQGVRHRCSFVEAAAEDLAPIDDGSVDVVTTRSVLIYSKDKRQAFREFYRVLRPGGRVSIFEPINAYFGYPSPLTYEEGPVRELGEKVRAVSLRIHPREDPMMDFDEHHLIEYAESSGFRDIDLDLHVVVRRVEPLAWETFLKRSGNPRIPPYGEAMSETLTPAEIDAYTRHLRPLVEQGRGVRRMASTFMRAIKL